VETVGKLLENEQIQDILEEYKELSAKVNNDTQLLEAVQLKSQALEQGLARGFMDLKVDLSV